MDSRPLSPHLQVYRLPLLAWLSIMHRGTGVFLAGAACLLPVYLGVLAFWPQYYDCLRGLLAAWYGQLFLFGVSVSVVYHLLNGLRHLMWDLGFNLQVRSAERSGLLVILFSIVLTVIIWYIACSRIYGGVQ